MVDGLWYRDFAPSILHLYLHSHTLTVASTPAVASRGGLLFHASALTKLSCALAILRVCLNPLVMSNTLTLLSSEHDRRNRPEGCQTTSFTQLS